MARLDSLRCQLATDVERGAMVPACKALLQIEFMQEDQPSLIDVCRILHSEAAQLSELSNLNRTLHGVLHCTCSEENRVKCDMGVVAKMFDLYRTELLRHLGSDTCCNFEALRYKIQSEFSALFSQIKAQGVLTADACVVLNAVDDSLACVLLAVSHQTVDSMPTIKQALHELILKNSLL